MAAHLARMSPRVRCAALAVACLAMTSPSRAVAQVTASPDDLNAILTRAGERVQQFFTRAQRILCLETVSMQPLTASLSPAGVGRTVESELRLSWEPDLGGGREAETLRQVLKVNGRPPRGRTDRRACTTPEQQSEETQPLSMLLPAQRGKYAFSLAGTTRLDGRTATMVDFREVGPVSVDVRGVEGLEDCITYEVTGAQRGRLWIDGETADVLRLDQHLAGMMDLRVPPALAHRQGAAAYLTLEREDTTIRFGRVEFHDPDESIVLPLSSVSLHIVRDGGTPRLRTVTTYTDYRRFLTGGRLVDREPGTGTP